MDIRIKQLLGGFVAVIMAGAASATVVLTTDIDATTQTGTTLIDNTFSSVVAANVGSQDASTVTVNGIDFLAGDVADSNNTSVTANGVTIAWSTDNGAGGAENNAGEQAAYTTAGDTDLGKLMGDRIFSGRTNDGDQNDITVTLSGLTDGLEYSVQLLIDQIGSSPSSRSYDDLTPSIGGPGPGAFQAGSNGGASAIWTFTADNTGVASILIDGDGTGAFNRANLSAVSVSVVPEPSSLALFALGGACLLRRRRA